MNSTYNSPLARTTVYNFEDSLRNNGTGWQAVLELD